MNKQYVIRRWQAEGGYREVLRIAMPMILSTAAWSIQHFVDRMFLTWYSTEAIAAVTPAGLFQFTSLCLFFGVAQYVNTFVAQYIGAKQDARVGPALWQGIYFCCVSALLLLLLLPVAPVLFRMIGHGPAIVELEIEYFRILTLGAVAPLLSAVISSFYTGRGEMKPIMWVNFLITAVNIALDYCMIFGRFGVPEMGMRGAAWATVIAQCVGCFCFAVLVFRPCWRERFATVSGWRFDFDLWRRLLRFGMPSGLQMMLEIFSFSLLIALIGRLGTVELAATNVSFNINTLAFMPMIGLGIAVTTLVGQRQGEGRSELAAFTTHSAAQIAFAYMGAIGLFYLCWPSLFIEFFRTETSGDEFERIATMSRVMLRFVAFYSLFDAFAIIYSSALKGAGDTRFVMFVSVGLAWSLMALPVYVFSVKLGYGVYTAWVCVTQYVFILGLIYLWRFSGGKWKSMRVIENAPPPPTSPPPVDPVEL